MTAIPEEEWNHGVTKEAADWIEKALKALKDGPMSVEQIAEAIGEEIPPAVGAPGESVCFPRRRFIEARMNVMDVLANQDRVQSKTMVSLDGAYVRYYRLKENGSS